MNTSRSNRLFQDGNGNSHITSLGNFYPGDEFKGDVARIIMYMYTRYPNQCQAIDTGYGTTIHAPLNDMPDVYLKWNAEDPVSQFEIDRNEIIYQNQGNRNPYIDNPYIATLIWNGQDAEDTWGTLSVPEEQFKKISVYPTYTSNYLYINGNTNNTNYKYTIYNVMGQEIQKSSTSQLIDISTLNSGLYLLNIMHDNTRQITKIIKL